jgi:5-(carboxyamino)imidazole ribonucleotide synthase
VIRPGATIGILGSGQLGRMLALAAAQLGYFVHVYSDAPPGSPAGQVAALEISASYEDRAALERFAASVDVVTVEFENIPAATLELLAAFVPVRPAGQILHVTQNRLREKQFLLRNALPHARFREVRGERELDTALADLGLPAVLKTAGFGYDGKGQVLLRSSSDLPAARQLLLDSAGVLEEFVAFRREVSVLVARSGGQMVDYGVLENHHEQHILDITTTGGPAGDPAAGRAAGLARRIAALLDYQGLLCVEFFETESGELLVNELAPRAHNSGHLTIEACVTSQFEQQVRAVCGLPPGSTQFHSAAAMANLLGDLWAEGEPDWATALADRDVKLHLYGKGEARPGRKMGHLVALAPTKTEAAQKVEAARKRLLRVPCG